MKRPELAFSAPTMIQWRLFWTRGLNQGNAPLDELYSAIAVIADSPARSARSGSRDFFVLRALPIQSTLPFPILWINGNKPPLKIAFDMGGHDLSREAIRRQPRFRRDGTAKKAAVAC